MRSGTWWRRALVGLARVLLILLALLVLCYLYEVRQCSRYVPTGDALFDRYGKEVIRRNRWRLFFSHDRHCTSLPDRLLARWEDQFGSDPRYWQLRIHSLLLSEQGEAAIPAMMPFNPIFCAPSRSQREKIAELLNAAEGRGAVDATLALTLADNHQSLQLAQLDSIEMELPYGADPTPDQRAEMRRINRQAEVDRLANLRRAIELAPESAWSYYECARYWYRLGEGELGLADLKAGNAAPVNRLLKLFPVSFTYDELAVGRIPGNATLAGAILESEMAIRANWLEWKDVMKEISVSAALSGEAEQLTSFHEFCCRLARADHATVWEFQTAGALLVGQLDYVQTELASGLTAPELRALKARQIAAWALLHRLDILQERIKPLVWDYYELPELLRITGYSDPAGTSGTQTQPEWEHTRNIVAAKALVAWIIPRYRFGDYLTIVKAEQQFQQSDVAQVMEELEGLDYVSPDERMIWLY